MQHPVLLYMQDNMGMQLLRYRDIPEGKYSNAFLGYGDEREQFVLEVWSDGVCTRGCKRRGIGGCFLHAFFVQGEG